MPQQIVGTTIYDTDKASLIAVFRDQRVEEIINGVMLSYRRNGDVELYRSKTDAWFLVTVERRWFGRRLHGDFYPVTDNQAFRFLRNANMIDKIKAVFSDRVNEV